MSLKDKRLFLLDMDGTVYTGDTPFDGVNDFLSYIEEVGGRYIFITNNSSRSVKDYVIKLSGMGIKVDENNFFTSSQATAMYVVEHYKGKKVYCCGTKSMIKEMEKIGVTFTYDREEAECIVVGYDTELTYQKMADVAYLLQTRKDIPYIATNPDRGCPIEFGLVPDCYGICEAINYAAKRRPLYIGKPDRYMIDYAMQMTNYTKDQTLLIGDRLYTDIASGYNAQIDTICVLSGESTMEDIEKSDIKPTYIYENIKEIVKVLREQ
ncbi:MAG: HAD-IIA family hydrolase [Clostridiales bacterium]|nr:HAD-IIA family hydrolase [Clostridiales bacterium]